MTAHYQNVLFTPAVKSAQEVNGSRRAYSRSDSAPDEPDRLTENEAAFIASRDSFYMATVGASGWPYVQHRGGKPGFVKVLDDRTLGLADYRGNRQYVSVGNLAGDPRASLFFMDYARQARLKVLGRIRAIDLAAEPELARRIVDRNDEVRTERALVIDIEAFDWNCPQHITPRFTIEEITPAIDKLKERIAELEEEVAELRKAGGR